MKTINTAVEQQAEQARLLFNECPILLKLVVTNDDFASVFFKNSNNNKNSMALLSWLKDFFNQNKAYCEQYIKELSKLLPPNVLIGKVNEAAIKTKISEGIKCKSKFFSCTRYAGCDLASLACITPPDAQCTEQRLQIRRTTPPGKLIIIILYDNF